VNREFGGRKPLEVVISDLTYVDVKGKWNYVCLLTELSQREIIGFSAGENKDAKLVEKAFLSVKIDLRKVNYFHTDRGSEFKNELIEKKLSAFGISRSLSHPGTTIDNAVPESMYDILKTEFVFGEEFSDVYDLQSKLEDWVWWYNNQRIHVSLGGNVINLLTILSVCGIIDVINIGGAIWFISKFYVRTAVAKMLFYTEKILTERSVCCAKTQNVLERHFSSNIDITPTIPGLNNRLLKWL
jgi:hypothetical protein